MIEMHGCFVQCLPCWAGSHSTCSSPSCRCQAARGLSDEAVHRLHEAQSSRPGPDNRRYEPVFEGKRYVDSKVFTFDDMLAETSEAAARLGWEPARPQVSNRTVITRRYAVEDGKPVTAVVVGDVDGWRWLVRRGSTVLRKRTGRVAHVDTAEAAMREALPYHHNELRP